MTSWAVRVIPVIGVPVVCGEMDEIAKWSREPVPAVMVGLVPVNELPSVPVTVVTVPATVEVVNTTVATPLELVVLVPEAKDPCESDLVQVTVRPDVFTGLLFASASCAVIVTSCPATGL